MTTATDASLATAARSRSWKAIGTTAVIVVERPQHVVTAERLARAEIDRFDRACSRFRGDAELAMLHAHSGRTVTVSPTLFEALDVACDVARRTAGAVDPTIGNAISALGYDRDYDEVLARRTRGRASTAHVVGYWHIHLDRGRRTVRIPRGVRLDLGSSAKALIADRAAARIADAVDAGALVSIGGDVAVAGTPPPGGWAIGIAEESRTPVDQVDQVVAITQGGLASSGPSVRQWQMGGTTHHHIIDPATGRSVDPYWTLVSATGASCVDANAATTAALVWGADAVDRLAPLGQSVRLVRADGRVVLVNGWPGEEAR